MTDKSLPKPVPPKDSPAPAPAGQVSVPPSVRVQPSSGKPSLSSTLTQKQSSPPVSDAQLPAPSSSQPAISSSSQPVMKSPVNISQSPPGGQPLAAAAGKSPSKSPGKSPTAAPPGQKPPITPLSNSGQPPAPAGSPASGKPTKQKPPQANFAQVKDSPFKYLPHLIGGLVLVGVIIFALSRVFGGGQTQSADTSSAATQENARKTVPTKEVSLTYWGLWEPENVLTETLDAFEAENPGVTISYVKQSHKDYRERLQTALASGNGPDIFRFHAAWTPMLQDELAPLPQSVMTASEYQQDFYPVAAEMLSLNGQVVGVPLMYEGLGLYYNKEMLQAANAEPPDTWAKLKLLASSLTVRSGGEIKRGGLAIGNASNVEHFADILALLMLQNGADLTQPDSKEAQDAMQFYTNFVKQDKVWSDKLPNSTVAFARGDAALMFAPSWRVHEIQELNPELDFGIVPVPRLGDQRIAWASFWAEGVNNKSDNKTEAWKLLQYLSQPEVQQQLYSAQSQIRSFGEIYSLQSLADDLAGDELVSPFLQDAPYAQGWYLASYTHDNGLNDLLIKYYQDAINAVLTDDKSVESVMETVAEGTDQVLRQYGVE